MSLRSYVNSGGLLLGLLTACSTPPVSALKVGANAPTSATGPVSSRKNLRREIESFLPMTIKVTRATPVFTDPNPRSKILADVDVGTQLNARELSARGAWLWVEDEDKHRGWIPRRRSDLAQRVRELRGGTLEDNEYPTTEPLMENQVDEARAERQPTVVPMSTVIFPAVQVGTQGFGGTVALLFPATVNVELGADRAEHSLFGFETGWSRQWNKQSPRPTVPLRLRMLRRSLRSNWATGPDLALLVRLPQGTEGKSLGTGLGYGVFYVPREDRGISVGLRLGVEFGGPTRYLAEWSTGWMF